MCTLYTHIHTYNRVVDDKFQNPAIYVQVKSLEHMTVYSHCLHEVTNQPNLLL